MMKFRTIKQALFDTIQAAEAGRWVTVGYQRQRSDVVQAKGFNRTVEIFFRQGEFPKSKNTVHGPKQHDITFEIMMFCSTIAKGDRSVLESSSSTAIQRQTAIAAVETAAALVDASMDELIEFIYQTVMSAATRYLGLSKGLFDVLHIESINKNDPHNEGDLVLIDSSMRVTCTTEEDVTGIIGDPAVSIDTDFAIKGDLVDNAGVATDPSS